MTELRTKLNALQADVVEIRTKFNTDPWWTTRPIRWR